MARANINDFITEIVAAGCTATENADGSLAISKNGTLKWHSVFWNIQQQGGYGWPGPSSKDGSTHNNTSSGLCEVSYSDRAPYPNDSITILPDGQSGSGAFTMRAQDFLDQL
jgi:hypothetical protein